MNTTRNPPQHSKSHPSNKTNITVNAVVSSPLRCAYCRNSLDHQQAWRCGTCKTYIHGACLMENQGVCTTLGCAERAAHWPNCERCREPLRSQASTVCLVCGWDLEEQRYLETEGLAPPSAEPSRAQRVISILGSLLFWSLIAATAWLVQDSFVFISGLSLFSVIVLLSMWGLSDN